MSGSENTKTRKRLCSQFSSSVVISRMARSDRSMIHLRNSPFLNDNLFGVLDFFRLFGEWSRDSTHKAQVHRRILFFVRKRYVAKKKPTWHRIARCLKRLRRYKLGRFFSGLYCHVEYRVASGFFSRGAGLPRTRFTSYLWGN